MGQLARGAECRRANHLCLISASCALLALAFPAFTVAKVAPAQKQYVLPHPRATGSAAKVGKHSAAPAGSYRGSSGNAALPTLLGGLGVIGGGAALTAYRKRRNHLGPPE
jgi:hypothetical protein